MLDQIKAALYPVQPHFDAVDTAVDASNSFFNRSQSHLYVAHVVDDAINLLVEATQQGQH